MASWYVGGTEMSRSSSDSSLPDGPYRQRRHHFDNKKRRPSYSELSSLPDDFKMSQPSKRYRLVGHPGALQGANFEQTVAQPAFFVIKRADAEPEAPAPPGPCEYFRVRPTSDPPGMNLPLYPKDKGHDEAARLVKADLDDPRRRSGLSRHERILRSLISPKSPEAEFDIDDVALQGIFYAVNEIFFRGRLKGRVTWAWRNLPSSLIGTTALRESPRAKGYETLIFLSRDILKDRKYNRRLLISTFIHELIHSYLFVFCGFHSRECGHTDGFRRIAELIDDWAGKDLLYLRNMEAELSHFETGLPKETAFDADWGLPWPHGPAAGDHILPNHHQCRLWPADVRLLGRDLL